MDDVDDQTLAAAVVLITQDQKADATAERIASAVGSAADVLRPKLDDLAKRRILTRVRLHSGDTGYVVNDSE